ncbi:MAG TPA: hypothetical protein VFX61_11595, partial [Micromonosporaceae bacterium]|nr:hypothetical protein [Micromonosporaceae bacterium]
RPALARRTLALPLRCVVALRAHRALQDQDREKAGKDWHPNDLVFASSSPLAGRPYDLRHAAVSLLLNSGFPATEVAERAGHSVDVLLKVYARCIDGQEATVNQRIEDALRGVTWVA